MMEPLPVTDFTWISEEEKEWERQTEEQEF